MKEVFEWKFRTPSTFERRHELDWWWCKKGSNNSNWARISRLGEFLFVYACILIIFVLKCVNMMPLLNHDLSFPRSWKISKNCLAASNIPSDNAWELTQFWVFVMNRLATRVTLQADANTVQKCYFSYFSPTRNRRVQVLYRQAPSSSFLGARRHKFF